MFFKSIHIKNFRNIENLKADFSPKFNFFIGKNAQGKTNIIESIYLFSFGRSFRTAEYRDLIKWTSFSSEVGTTSLQKNGEDDLRITLDENKKSFLKNSKRTIGGGFDGVAVVLFAPEEILLLRDSPSERRRYIDSLISEIIPTYKKTVRNYEKVVNQRNNIFHDETLTERQKIDNLYVWDEQLVTLGAKIITERMRWLKRLNDFIPNKYNAIAPDDHEATFDYRPQLGDEILGKGEGEIREKIKHDLKARQKDELIRCFTIVGPHRDDIEARINKVPVKNFGSQGQHRTFVLALKIAEIDLLREEMGETPILILDDVASELDADRNRFFFEYLSEAKGQVFVTATDVNDIKIGTKSEIQRFNIQNGKADLATSF